MCTLASIGVYYYFSARKAGVAMWPANYKFAGRVNMVFYLPCKQLLDVRRKLRFYPRNQNVDNVGLDLLQHFFLLVKIVVLGRNYDGIDPDWSVVVGVLNRYLRFGVGPEVLYVFFFSSQNGQLSQ